MKNKIIFVLLVLFSILGLASCRTKTQTPTLTPTPSEEAPVAGYNIVFYTFNVTKDPTTLKNQTKIPSELPTLEVNGYEFDCFD